MDMLGGSPTVRLLPDRHTIHPGGVYPKRVFVVQRSNSGFVLLIHTPIHTPVLERRPAKRDTFPGFGPPAVRPSFESAVPMTKDEERELQEQLARLQQEHRDLDAAISALQHSPGSDLLQVQRLKKRKLYLRDRISHIEDQLTPDIIA
jgi:hypothetical protein